jgi:hypothetical protein
MRREKPEFRELDLGSVDRILTATGDVLGPEEKNGLLKDLNVTFATYRVIQLESEEDTPKQRSKGLAAFEKAIKEALSAFREYAAAGSPHWEDIVRAGDGYQCEASKERERLRAQYIQASKNDEAEKLERRRAALGDAQIWLADHGPEGLLAQTELGLAILADLIESAELTTANGTAANSAARWLFCKAIPDLLWKHLKRFPSSSNIHRGEMQEVDGPSIRFAEQVAIELGVISTKTGELYARKTIKAFFDEVRSDGRHAI